MSIQWSSISIQWNSVSIQFQFDNEIPSQLNDDDDDDDDDRVLNRRRHPAIDRRLLSDL